MAGSSSGVRPTARAIANRSESRTGRCSARLIARTAITRRGHPEDEAAEGPNAALEVVLRGAFGEVAGDLAIAGPGARRGDHALPRAADHAGPEEAEAVAVVRTGRPERRRRARTWARRGLAGERRFVDVEMVGLEDPDVCRDDVAGAEHTKSSRTTSWIGTSCRAPSRTTVACRVRRAWSAATAVSERASWTNPSAALMATMARMIAAVTSSPTTRLTRLAARGSGRAGSRPVPPGSRGASGDRCRRSCSGRPGEAARPPQPRSGLRKRRLPKRQEHPSWKNPETIWRPLEQTKLPSRRIVTVTSRVGRGDVSSCPGRASEGLVSCRPVFPAIPVPVRGAAPTAQTATKTSGRPDVASTEGEDPEQANPTAGTASASSARRRWASSAGRRRGPSPRARGGRAA